VPTGHRSAVAASWILLAVSSGVCLFRKSWSRFGPKTSLRIFWLLDV
jgi:hypothetical protein